MSSNKNISDTLCHVLDYEYPSIQSLIPKRAITSLGVLQTKKGIDTICDYLKDDIKNKDILGHSIYVLGYCDKLSDKIKPVLISILNNKKVNILNRSIAAKSLAELGDKSILPRIEKMMPEAKGDARLFLKIAKGLLGEKVDNEEINLYFKNKKAKSDYLVVALPFYLIRNGYLSKEILESITYKLMGYKPLYTRLQKYFPDGPHTDKLTKFPDIAKFMNKFNEYVKENMNNLKWNPDTKTYRIKIKK